MRYFSMSFCLRLAAASCLLMLLAAGCTREPAPLTEAEPPQKLSEFGLFLGNGSTQQPAEGVIPYELNSALFSDYAEKFRFVKLPPGGSAKYSENDAFDFPVGTIIAKTFAYSADSRKPNENRRLIETRILQHTAQGWVGLPYIWNNEQTEAVLEVAGDTVDVTWLDAQGQQRTNNYIIPNSNQCKGCHKQGEEVLPIGPKARHLNRDFTYAEGTENQLAHWKRVKALAGAPDDPNQAPRLAVWNDPASGSLDDRARAWLEINCAHCHNPLGPARTSGLDLLASQKNPTQFGIFKTPVAAGRGSGPHSFDIVPGQPDKSIIVFRIASTDGGIMMPELGKRMVHTEGVELVREWIAAMPQQGDSPPVP